MNINSGGGAQLSEAFINYPNYSNSSILFKPSYPSKFSNNSYSSKSSNPSNPQNISSNSNITYSSNPLYSSKPSYPLKPSYPSSPSLHSNSSISTDYDLYSIKNPYYNKNNKEKCILNTDTECNKYDKYINHLLSCKNCKIKMNKLFKNKNKLYGGARNSDSISINNNENKLLINIVIGSIIILLFNFN